MARDSSAEGSWWAPDSRVLAAAWVVVAGILVAGLSLGVRATGEFERWSTLLQIGYVAALLWFLGRTESPRGRLAGAGSAGLGRSSSGKVLSATALALVLAMSVLSDEGDDVALVFMMAATVWVLAAWHRKVRSRQIVVGSALAATAFVAGLPFRGREVVSDTGLVLLPAFVLPMFVAAGLLMDRTGLGGSQLHLGRFRAAAGSFARGCVLFVPLGLVNAADDAPGTGVGWITEAWMPLSLPLFSGIAEEAWFRLLLVPLAYFLLRPVFEKRPEAAVLCAALFSAVVFGLGHGRSLDRLLTTGLLYGLPLAVVFVRRDWEHAVGGHYMINMIPWSMAYLES